MKRKQHLQSFLSVCLVQLQDLHDMQENVFQSNLQLVFLQTNNFKEEASEFYSTACIFELNLFPKLKKLKDFKWDRTLQNNLTCEPKGLCWHDLWVTPQMVLIFSSAGSLTGMLQFNATQVSAFCLCVTRTTGNSVYAHGVSSCL